MFRRAAALGRRQQLLRLVLRGGSVGSGTAAPSRCQLVVPAARGATRHSCAPVTASMESVTGPGSSLGCSQLRSLAVQE